MGRFRQLTLNMRLRPESTFDSWVGEAGRQLQSLMAPGLILVQGNACSGRSHLLQAACASARERGWSAMYVERPADLEPAALDDLGELQLVCIDNPDEIAAHANWEESLFHLVNASRDGGHILVLAGPVQFELPDLRSRVEGAVAVTTDRLDDAGKGEVLRARAHRLGYELSDDATRYLLRRHARDLPSLLAVASRLEALSLERQKTVSLALLRQALAETS